MKIFVDTNIFISAIENSKNVKTSQTLLNSREHEIGTGLLNLMEIRTVLTKKKHRPQKDVDRVIEWLKNYLDFIHDEPPSLEGAEERQIDTLLYPMDCLILESSNSENAILTTYEKELRHHNCVHPKYLI